MNAPHVALRQLARAAGLQTGYMDVLGHQHRVSPEVILAALNAPDIDIATIEQDPAALHTFQHQHLAQRVELTIVTHPNRRNVLSVFLPSSSKPERFTVVLQQEDGTTHEWSVRAAELPRRGQEHDGTDTYSIARLGLPALPMGYYTLSLHFLAGIAATTHILCAPVHCWLPSEETRWWGIFFLQRDGQLDAVAADPAVVRRFCYAQWLTEQQGLQVARSAHAQRVGLYLDHPIGVHAQSCDTWRWHTTFARNMSVGAPPDAFYPEGQVWNFPPLHPLHTREQGYAYVRAIMRRHLVVGQLLRLDHVMGLHRLSWVPKGASGRDGIYVHYPAEELSAVLAIESQRAQAVLIGEDLGTVPWSVRDSMRRHHLLGMSILPFEQRGAGFATPSPLSLAALNTHDLLPFAALWQSLTSRQRHATLHWLQRRGWLSPDGGADDRACYHALTGLLTFLAASPARILFVNAKDLWRETEPQNRPGTGAEQPNWRRKARLPLEAWSANPDLIHVLNRIRQLRTKAAQGKEAR